MALFGRDYDREYGYYGGGRPNRYDRDRGWWGGNRESWQPGYDRGYGPGGAWDRSFDRGYDRGFKSRWQTDYGDPFGDRANRTPMRVTRGPYGHGSDAYDRAFWNRDSGSDYSNRPMSYDPYRGREGTWMRGNERNYRTYGGGYDTGWF